MTAIGWEFFGIKFSMFIAMLVSVLIVLFTLFITKKNNHFTHIDKMAGDEGDE